MKKEHTVLILWLVGFLISHQSISQIKAKLTKLKESKSYMVSIIPERDYLFPNEIVGSIQLTLKVPQSNTFILGTLVSQIEETEWLRNNVLEGYKDFKNNYYTIGTEPLGSKVKLHKGEEVKLFSFYYSGDENLKLEMMDNTDEALPIVENKLSLDMYNNISIHKRNNIKNDYSGNITAEKSLAESDKSEVWIEGVYPNPASDKIKVIWYNYYSESEKLKINVTDILGKEIKVSDQSFVGKYGKNENELNISSLIEGSYYISIKNEANKVFTNNTKLIISK